MQDKFDTNLDRDIKRLDSNMVNLYCWEAKGEPEGAEPDVPDTDGPLTGGALTMGGGLGGPD